MRMSPDEVHVLFAAVLAYRRLQMKRLSARASLKRSRRQVAASPEIGRELKVVAKLIKKLRRAEVAVI